MFSPALTWELVAGVKTVCQKCVCDRRWSSDSASRQSYDLTDDLRLPAVMILDILPDLRLAC